jgi:hypothetical protein
MTLTYLYYLIYNLYHFRYRTHDWRLQSVCGHIPHRLHSFIAHGRITVISPSEKTLPAKLNFDIIEAMQVSTRFALFRHVELIDPSPIFNY